MKKVILSLVLVSLVILNSCQSSSVKNNISDSIKVKSVDSVKIVIDSVKIVDSLK